MTKIERIQKENKDLFFHFSADCTSFVLFRYNPLKNVFEFVDDSNNNATVQLPVEDALYLSKFISGFFVEEK
jgi:hypothetical protein